MIAPASSALSLPGPGLRGPAAVAAVAVVHGVRDGHERAGSRPPAHAATGGARADGAGVRAAIEAGAAPRRRMPAELLAELIVHMGGGARPSGRGYFIDLRV